jgi:2-keto-4-pentenoate hydratase/2-oxohepta-3-ene-1,7-dioic acid hydratase in catechol pathway
MYVDTQHCIRVRQTKEPLLKILRAQSKNQQFYAQLKDDQVHRISGLPYSDIVFTGEVYSLTKVDILAPCEPTKIVAVGRNYAAHASELNNAMPKTPMLFLKPSSSVIASGCNIVYPRMSARVDFEAELGVVIGKTCSNVSANDAHNYIFGYTPLNDVTARDLQDVDKQWGRAKGFDTFCPLGPIIYTDYNPAGKRVQSILRGEVQQDGNTADMHFNVFTLISFISEVMTLLPGDVIATGTPAGVGPMAKGDTIEIRIEGMEPLINKVV